MIHLINIAQASGTLDDAPSIPQLLLNVLNFLLQAFGIIAIIALLISGIFYLTTFGDEDRIKTAKRSMAYSITGIAVALAGIIIIKTISGLLK